MMTPFICKGCEQPIMERYLMKVLDKSWHMQCVKCSDCQCVLSESCYSRDSKLYCRADFFKRYGTKCARCNLGLCPEDLVRTALNKVYHVQCFACTMCHKQMTTGEQLYLVQGETFLCSQCYKITAQSLVSKTAAVTTSSVSSPSTQDSGKHGTAASQPSDTVLSSPYPPSADGKRPKPRTSITPKQLEILTQSYNEDQHPSKQVREDLVSTTGLEMKVIQVWFQNRRSKEKRDASYREAAKDDTGVVTQPPVAMAGAVSLPPVTSIPAGTAS